MKKAILILFALAFALTGCKDDDKNGTLPVELDLEQITFTPVAGGTILSYVLPKDSRVYGIKATYVSTATGKQELVVGTYSGTEILLKGFIEAETAAKAKLSLVGFDGSESKSLDVTFATLPASALAIFDEIRVEPYWSGFSVKFNAGANADGFINIGYMGIDPITQKPGVILKETKVIDPGENKVLSSNISETGEIIEAVIWTEDFAGNEVHRQTYQVLPIMTKLYDSSKITYTGDSLEDEDKKVGWKYLFDGDTKGIKRMQARGLFEYHHFITESLYDTHPEGVLDLGETQDLASFRLYILLNNDIQWTGYWSTYDASSSAPNHFKLYLSSDKENWTEIATFFQAAALDEQLWWCFPFLDRTKRWTTVEELEAADPCYAEVNFDVMESQYRYLKIQFLSAFGPLRYNSRIIASEMEVYVRK